MTWLAFLLLAMCAVLPVLLTLRRVGSQPHSQTVAVTLFRAQLAELDRDLADGRIVAVEHAAASLEVQRRLLAATEAMEPGTPPVGRREPVMLAMVMVVAVALGLYALHGRADLAAQGAAAATLEASDSTRSDQAGLQRMIAGVDAVADGTRQEQIQQGDRAQRGGDLATAADLWRQALAIRFDPVLAVRIADAESTVNGHIGFHAAALFRRALAAVPLDAPWRGMVERRLAEAERP